MDRRATIAMLVGQKTEKKAQAQNIFAPTPPVAGLEPYTGTWGYDQAAHLLRRATFGATHVQIKNYASQNLKTLLDDLFKTQPIPAPPINYDGTDPIVPVGSTWINGVYLLDANKQISNMAYRDRSLRAWTTELLLDASTVSLREKMTLFWHNHFSVNGLGDPKFYYVYIDTLRQNALGNFRELVKKITIDPTMLIFLNGNQNSSAAPNENYARELLELFTIGKGVLAGPGDYTNYTETDVKEIARAMTGWRDTGYRSTDPTVSVGSTFKAASHDTKTKTLSARFDSKVINNNLDKEYADVVDIIFTKDEVARFISRKLYRYFVFYQITPDVETNVIQPMAQLLVKNNYDIAPALRSLLSSAHFFDAQNLGLIIKNPLEFSLGAIREFGWNIPTDTLGKYRTLYSLFLTIVPQQMEYFAPPDVAGWKAYYQAPVFNRIWINVTTLIARMRFTDALAYSSLSLNGVKLHLDVLGFIAKLDDPGNPAAMIKDMTKAILPQPLADGQYAYLKDVLLNGVPDYEWTNEYAAFINKPDDKVLRQAVELKLRLLVKALLNMPEYFLG
jgi:uncharacterized protein (DUF1800 family)